MIALLRALLVGIPSTIWYGIRIVRGAGKGGRTAECTCEELPRAWARSLLWAAGVEVVLENAESIDPDRPQVLVANHVSWFDVLALAAFMPGPYRFVAKKELTKVPFFGPAWQACGHIAIDRDDRKSAIESLAVARRRLEEDRPTVILFPEGTRSEDGELRPFKKGAFVLAIQTGVEVVPAAVLGSREVMKKGSFLIRPGRVTIRFGSPISVDGMTVSDRDRLTDRARESVAALLTSGALPE
ncbi:MAG: lysophospholipid acyltransferase family protein [Longimicrobiales bacterium]